MKKTLHTIYIEPVNRAKFYKDGVLKNEYLYHPDFHECCNTEDNIPVFIITPYLAFKIFQTGVYDRIDIYLTSDNLAYYEGEGEPGSVTGWVSLDKLFDVISEPSS